MLDVVIRVSDLIIGLCYVIIAPLIYCIARSDLMRNPSMRLLRYTIQSIVAFVFFCGITHVILFMNVNLPVVQATFLVICAVVSVLTASLLSANLRNIISLLTNVEVTSLGNTLEMTKSFKMAVDLVKDMVSVHDVKTLKFLIVNRSWLEYGISEEAFLHKTLFDVVHGEDATILDVLTRREIQTCTYRICIDGSVYNVESSYSVGNVDGKTVFVVITRNIDKRIENFMHELRHKTEQTRVETNRLHAMLLAHDLRTPLSILELAIDDVARNDRDAQKSAVRSIHYMKYFINRVVESCRVLNGEHPIPTLERVDVVEIVKRCVDYLSIYPSLVRIETHCTLRDDATEVRLRCGVAGVDLDDSSHECSR